MASLFCVLMMSITVVSGRRVVDLTHTLDENAPKVSLQHLGITNQTYFKRDKTLEQYITPDTWLALGAVEFFEHTGTHIDAPFHLGSGRQKLHEVPAERLVGPGVVIDVKDKVKDNLDYAVSVQDILDYEKKFGRIPSRAIVMMNSGWDERYPDEKLVFGTEDIGHFGNYHYPGYSPEACKMLFKERQINVLGSDSPSVDPQQVGIECHKYLQALEVPLVEYVANLDSIPQSGTTIILGAPKIRDGSGAPTRVLAFVYDEGDDVMDNSANPVSGSSALFVLLVFTISCASF